MNALVCRLLGCTPLAQLQFYKITKKLNIKHTAPVPVFGFSSIGGLKISPSGPTSDSMIAGDTGSDRQALKPAATSGSMGSGG
jgi:hypothetical protein